MTSEIKGFAGLNGLLSDVSEEISQRERESQSPAQPLQPDQPQSAAQPETNSTPGSAPLNSSSPISTEPQAAHPSRGSSSAKLFLAVGIVVLIAFVVATNSNEKNPGNNPSSNVAVSTQPSPQTSPYAQAIPEIEAKQSVGLERMLSASQSGGAKDLEVEVANLEKARSQKSSPDKAAAKTSREKNALGLNAHKAGRFGEAANLFFEAFNLNPADVEITDNLGTALYGIAEYESAAKAFRLALAASPKRASAWLGLAKIYARSNDTRRAAAAFNLAFHYTKAPKSIRQTVLALSREEANVSVRNAAGAALSAHYASLVAPFLRPALGNLTDTNLPVYLPTKATAQNFEGSPLETYVVNNDMFPIEANQFSYKLPLASEWDCRASYCKSGSISATRITGGEKDLGDPVELYGGIKGTIIKDDYRGTSQLVFVTGSVRYVFELGAKAEMAIEAANSALKLGPLPTDVFSSIPKLR